MFNVSVSEYFIIWCMKEIETIGPCILLSIDAISSFLNRLKAHLHLEYI